MEYHTAIKKNEILTFVTTWMDPEGIMLSEISQTEKDKCCMLSLICGMQKTKERNEYNKHKYTYRYREQISGYQ